MAVLSLPPLEEAVESLRAFLARKGLPTELLFVFREDVYGTSPGELFVYAAAAPASTAAAAHYARARHLGLAEVAALGGTPTLSVVTVHSPAPHEVQGWDRGLRVTIREPFAKATLVSSPLLWRLHRLRPSYRRWQRYAFSVDRRPRDPEAPQAL